MKIWSLTLYVSKVSIPDSCFVLSGTHQWYPINPCFSAFALICELVLRSQGRLQGYKIANGFFSPGAVLKTGRRNRDRK